MSKSCLIYSLSDFNIESLRPIASSRGWTVTGVFNDSPGAELHQRHGFAAVKRLVAAERVQAVLVPSLLAIGGSLDDLVAFAASLSATNISLVVIGDAIDTATTEGAAWLATMASLHQWKRDQVNQRAKAGARRAREAGSVSGALQCRQRH